METHTGIAHGKFIELDNEMAFPEGQPVSVVVQPLVAGASAVEPRQPESDIGLAFGAWADEAEAVDKFLEWNRQQRKVGRPEIEE